MVSTATAQIGLFFAAFFLVVASPFVMEGAQRSLSSYLARDISPLTVRISIACIGFLVVWLGADRVLDKANARGEPMRVMFASDAPPHIEIPEKVQPLSFNIQPMPQAYDARMPQSVFEPLDGDADGTSYDEPISATNLTQGRMDYLAQKREEFFANNEDQHEIERSLPKHRIFSH